VLNSSNFVDVQNQCKVVARVLVMEMLHETCVKLDVRLLVNFRSDAQTFSAEGHIMWSWSHCGPDQYAIAGYKMNKLWCEARQTPPPAAT